MQETPRQPKYKVTVEFCDDDQESQEALVRAVTAILERDETDTSLPLSL